MQPAPYGPYKFSLINRRPKLTWPGGARVALWVITNIEFFALDVALPGDGNARPKNNEGTPMVRQWGQRDYGNRVGIVRLMDLFDRYGIRSTVALNSDICDMHPEIIEECLKRNWDFMGHNRTNTQRLSEVAPEKEGELIAHVFKRIGEATGKRPAGWLGSGLVETWNTLDHLITEGCQYVADWCHDDQPVTMTVDGKTIVSLPYTYELNDMSSLVREKHTPGEFERMIKDQFDVLYAEGEQSGRVMAIALHPFLMGQPHRVAALDRALAYIDRHAGVWKATGAEITQAYLKSGVVI